MCIEEQFDMGVRCVKRRYEHGTGVALEGPGDSDRLLFAVFVRLLLPVEESIRARTNINPIPSRRPKQGSCEPFVEAWAGGPIKFYAPLQGCNVSEEVSMPA